MPTKGPGGARLGSIETPLADWQQVFQVNFFAPIMLARGLIAELEKAKGAVVNVTSIAGGRVHPFAGAAYATSKAALASLTREMAADFGPRGIRVNAISPGEIDTAKARAVRKLAWALGEAYDARLPLTRRIERENTNPALADSLRQRRQALTALVPKLKMAEGNAAAYQQAAAQVVAEWEAMLGLYERMASPELRGRVKPRHEAVIAVSAHH